MNVFTSTRLAPSSISIISEWWMKSFVRVTAKQILSGARRAQKRTQKNVDGKYKIEFNPVYLDIRQ